MKKIRIIAIIAMIVFIGSNVTDMIEGFSDGMKDSQSMVEHQLQGITLQVKADGTMPTDSLFNTVKNAASPYSIGAVTVSGIERPVWHAIYMLVLFPVGLFSLYAFYCVVRVVLSVTKGQVFTRRNVRWMRFFVYILIGSALCLELEQWGTYNEAASQLKLAGYEVIAYSIKYSWFEYVMLALFTEIFAVGVKMKEEQDLTI